MIKNGCGQSGLWALKLTVSKEWTDGINRFFAYWYKFMQVKRCLKFLGCTCSKIGVASLMTTLKLTISEEWTDGIIDFLCVNTDSMNTDSC